MATKKLIVVAHGIGVTPANFHEGWKQAIAKQVDLSNAEVVGLYWEHLLTTVENRYGLVDEKLAEAVAACGFGDLQKWIANENYQTFNSFFMDVLVYIGLGDMWQKIQDACVVELQKLRFDAENKKEIYSPGDTILIGHSLGAAMFPQLAWRDYVFNGSMPYRGMILLASPLALRFPGDICAGFLGRMGEAARNADRNTVLRNFAAAWDTGGPGRLRFISNDNDIVCADVAYNIPGLNKKTRLVPLQMGFSAAEQALLNGEHPGAVQNVTFGEPDPRQVLANHDVFAYFRQPAFATALTALLQG